MTYSNSTTGRLLAIVLFAIVLFGAPINSRAAGASELTAPIVVERTVDIEYGKQITISVKLDTGSIPSEIATVRALFRPDGGNTVWAYSYPEFLNANDVIFMTFVIPVGPGSYYPPGVEFDVRIELTPVDGQMVSVELADSVEYLNPAFDWQRVSGNGYTVIYYGVDRSRVVSLVETVDFRIPTLQATLGVTETPDFKAIVFPSIQAATPSFPPVSQTATDQYLFAGFAQPEYRLFVQGQMNSTTFTHELAHLYTHEAVSNSFVGGLPAWLNEGLARFLETGSSEQSNARLRSNVRPSDLLSLRNMRTIPGQSRDVSIFYPQAGAFVGYLVEQFGHATMAEYLSKINAGGKLLDAFSEVYGQFLYDVENDWREQFDADPLPTPVAIANATTSPGSVESTTVPLVDFNPAVSGTPGLVSTTSPETLPTATSPNPTPVGPGVPGGEDEPASSLLVAGVVIGLSAVVGVWLFTSRRRMPKPKA